jgi:hypothetical protein
LHWLLNSNEIYGDDLNDIRRETSRHVRNKKREYLKDKINELPTDSKRKNIRDLYKELNNLRAVTNLEVKDESGDLLEDSHNISNKWISYSSLLLNVHRVNDVR